MYLPEHFREERLEAMHKLIQDYPLGTLVTHSAAGLSANHIPFLMDPEPTPYGTLRGHVARHNPVWQEHSADVDALVIFQGPDAYISPNWYPSKALHGKVVPTWNYAVVHVYGPLKVVDDSDWLRHFLTHLTDRHEASQAAPWRVADAPEDYLQATLRAVVGIEISVSRMIGKWKASQNRSDEDRAGVAQGLEAAHIDSTYLVTRLG